MESDLGGVEGMTMIKMHMKFPGLIRTCFREDP